METETAADRYYKSHLKRVSDYQKANPEKCQEKCKKYNQKVKEDPDQTKYQSMLEKKRQYYYKNKPPRVETDVVLL